jgi:DNA-binding response OmpR family regulator
VNEPSVRLRRAIQFLESAGGVRHRELVLGERAGSSWTVGEVSLPDGAEERFDPFLAQTALERLEGDDGDCDIVPADGTEAASNTDPDRIAYVDETDLELPQLVSPVVEGESVTEHPGVSASLDAPDAAFRAIRVADGDTTVVGVQTASEPLWDKDGPFTVAATDKGYAVSTDPVLVVPDGLDALFVDGAAFVFAPSAVAVTFATSDDKPTEPDPMPTDEDKPTVLVVDDDPGVRGMFVEFLERHYEVRTASDGEAALKAYGSDVNAVLLDRMMPELSGDEVLKRLREWGAECGVAMVTAVDPDVDIVDMPFDDYVTKPVAREELRGTVEGLLMVEDYDELQRELSSMRVRRNVLSVEQSGPSTEKSEELRRLEASIETLEFRLDAADKPEPRDSSGPAR